MSPPTEKTFGIYELTERILLHLDDYLEIIRVQRVCRIWRDVIQTSPALQKICWYQPNNIKDAQTQSTSGEQSWKLSPAFNRIGISVSKDTENGDGLQDKGDFTLQERIYDTPGSWTTMRATQPPCQRMLVECYGDYSGDETMYYLIVSMTEYLLMGDVMAVLAECQNRQQYGLDRWAGVRHYTGRLVRWEESDWDSYHWSGLGRMLDDDVSIKVAVELPWGDSGYPAFSLRRLATSKEYLQEMILHKMIREEGHEYEWDFRYLSRPPKPVPCKGEYKANLLVVREHQEGYLSDCSHIFRLLSDIERPTY